jgi:hypothetical protein
LLVCSTRDEIHSSNFGPTGIEINPNYKNEIIFRSVLLLYVIF